MVEESLARFEVLLEDMRSKIEKLEERLRPEPMAFSYVDAAARLGVGLTKMKQMVKRKQVRTTEVGGVPMVPLAELVRITTPATERPKAEQAARAKAWVPVSRRKKR